MGTETTIYFLAAVILLYLYRVRTKGLEQVGPDTFPEMEKDVFFEFKRLLDTAYERMLYVSLVFFLLGIITLFRLPPSAKIIAYVALAGLFVYNIPPRKKIFHFIEAFNLDPKTLKERGIRL